MWCAVASPQIEPRHWVEIHAKLQALLDQDDIVGAVVTHGTATLEETAWFLDLTLVTGKPVVVTGAQRNASESDFDGPRNLREALRICQSPDACGRGVLVALNSHINAAREVTKTHTLDVETFQSNEWGYLGAVLHDRIVFHRRPERRLHLPLASGPLPRVEIVSMYAGADGAMVDAAADSGARGLVCAIGGIGPRQCADAAGDCAGHGAWRGGGHRHPHPTRRYAGWLRLRGLVCEAGRSRRGAQWRLVRMEGAHRADACAAGRPCRQRGFDRTVSQVTAAFGVAADCACARAAASAAQSLSGMPIASAWRRS